MWSLKHEIYKSDDSGILECDTVLTGKYLPTPSEQLAACIVAQQEWIILFDPDDDDIGLLGNVCKY